MRFDLLQPCRECPFACKVPGWIGDYDEPEQLIALAEAQVPFPCHMTMNKPNEQHCAGIALMRRNLCSMPRLIDVAAHQRRVVATGATVPPPDVMVRIHREGRR